MNNKKGITDLIFNNETYTNKIQLNFDDNSTSSYRSSLDKTLEDNNGLIQKITYKTIINN
ncbi:hypothetical protein [Spiroplasma turonicum]|uniref:Uncharacterized protein n=1 Tax=Spiroplasma turonicum TaxID=216946 RepID=A0A0K1P6Q4_9MOLU|nr:hypothetical protein [Spiroplasma turonicum]AKU79970.1 hypothetical protein STURON_00724 [Spiroplasma turonicum]